MPDNPEQPDVWITVESKPSSTDEEPYLRSDLSVQKSDYVITVPVTETLLNEYTGINVQRFLRTAVALAADNDGRILLLGVETVTDGTELEAVREYVRSEKSTDLDQNDTVEILKKRQTQLAKMAGVAQELEPAVSVSAVVRVVTDVTEGVLGVVDDGGETAVLLLRGTGLDESWLLSRSTVDTILEDADCDVFVENMGEQGGEHALYVPDVEEHTVASLAETQAESIESVLLPVGDGPHAALAAEAARGVALAADASVTVLHVVPPDAPQQAIDEGEELLKFAEYILGSDLNTETKLEEASDTAEEIIREAEGHDFVSIGAPEEKNLLEQLVFESVDRTLSEKSETTVLMSRDPDRVMRSLYYRWKRGIEAEESDGDSEN